MELTTLKPAVATDVGRFGSGAFMWLNNLEDVPTEAGAGTCTLFVVTGSGFPEIGICFTFPPLPPGNALKCLPTDNLISSCLALSAAKAAISMSL